MAAAASPLVADTTVATPQPTSWMPTVGRVLKPVAVVASGAVLGSCCFSVTKQGRLRTPAVPLATSKIERITELPAKSVLLPQPYQVPVGDYCGAAVCTQSDKCCPGGPGYGYACGTDNAVCCQGELHCEDGTLAQYSYPIVCHEGDECCVNHQGFAYCCADNLECAWDVCLIKHHYCFPGHATVDVLARGQVPLADVQTGDRVLSQTESGVLRYEAVIGFLHHVPGEESNFMVIEHSQGALAVSRDHLVFVRGYGDSMLSRVAGEIGAGDEVVLVQSAQTADNVSYSKVVAIKEGRGKSGMYAPLTGTGRVVVDGVLASTYALPMELAPVSHSVLHGAFFVGRARKALLPNLSSLTSGFLVSLRELQQQLAAFATQSFIGMSPR